MKATLNKNMAETGGENWSFQSEWDKSRREWDKADALALSLKMTPELAIRTPSEESKRPSDKAKEDSIPETPLLLARELFETKHGGFVTDISKTFSIDRSLLTSLIGRESHFDAKAKHPGGSSGLMQLTGIVFADLAVGNGGRAAKYEPFFRKLSEILPPDAPKSLVTLCDITTGKEPGSIVKWNRSVAELRSKKFDPSVNLAIGSILLSNMKEEIEAKTEAPKPKDKERLGRIFDALGHPKNLKKVCVALRDLGHVGNASSPETIASKLSDLKSELGSANDASPLSDRLVTFLSLRKYNGNPATEAAGLRHKDLYAAMVLFSGDAEKMKSARN